AAALACFGLGIAVARYHVIQRIFHEELVMLSAVGVVVHFGLILAVGTMAMAVMSASRVLQRHQRGITAGVAALLTSLMISSGAAVLASTARENPTAVRSAAAAAKGHPNVI